MGIQGLMKLIADEAPNSHKEIAMEELMGRKVAVDASMALYQFLIAVRSGDGSAPAQMLTNEAGEVTSHIQGIFNRTIRMLQSGIKPVYVFDGKPPEMKMQELKKRKTQREKAEADMKAAEEAGGVEDVDKFSKRTTRVTQQHNDDCKRLLRLMGVPIVEAPCEAEASCATLAKAGVVYGTASEDMDSLTFRTPVLLRRMTFGSAAVLSIDCEKVISGLGLTYEQFVDLCILCGCDYCDSIKGIGPKKAHAAIKKYGNIEGFLKNLKENPNKGVQIPEDWLSDEPIFVQAREMFLKPEVVDPSSVQLKWADPDEEGLKKFLVDDMGFNEQRVLSNIEKLKKTKNVHSQRRMDSFFKVIPSDNTNKRKPDAKENAKVANKKARGGKTGGRGRR